jgi:hypothetical protein
MELAYKDKFQNKDEKLSYSLSLKGSLEGC